MHEQQPAPHVSLNTPSIAVGTDVPFVAKLWCSGTCRSVASAQIDDPSHKDQGPRKAGSRATTLGVAWHSSSTAARMTGWR